MEAVKNMDKITPYVSCNPNITDTLLVKYNKSMKYLKEQTQAPGENTSFTYYFCN